MTEEIKERIEQIRCGALPEGYKSANVGIIPQEWKISNLRDIGQKRLQKNTDFKIRLVFSNSAQHGIIPQEEQFEKSIANKEHIDGYYIVNPEDFVYNPRISVTAPCGPINRNETKKIGIVSPLYTVFTVDFPKVDNSYLKHYFKSSHWFQYMKGVANYGVRHDRMNISDADFFAMPLPIPPLAEQQKIAAILSAQDKIIELQERLLREKRRQKKYLMQRLLTGKQRLPGFTGEWKTLKAREVFQSVTDKNHHGDLEVLLATQDRGIIPRSQVEIDIKYDEAALPTYKKVKKGNFVISLRSFQGGIEYSAYEGLVSPAYTVLKNRIPIDSGYYKQYFKSARYIAQLQIAVYGIRDGKQISYDDFGFIDICYPPIAEQTAIADILSAADWEIDLLQRKLEQEKRQKKALSQLLLTGIVRV